VNIQSRQNITFINNTSQIPAEGPLLIFAYVDRLTVYGNSEPVTSGSLTSITNCANVSQ